MKKLIFVILLSVIGINAKCQLVKNEILKEFKIGVEKRGFIKYAELTYIPKTSPTDTMYHLFYKDEKYKQLDEWKSIYFNGGSATLNDFYEALKEAITADKGKETSFTLSDNKIFIVTSRLLGKYLSISITDKTGVNGIMTLTKGQIKDLFGKDEVEHTTE
jgi:hypothetical protein